MTFTEKSLPAILSTKYLKGGMLTVIIPTPFPGSPPLQDNKTVNTRRVKNFFIIFPDRQGTNLILNITCGPHVVNKILSAIFGKQ